MNGHTRARIASLAVTAILAAGCGTPPPPTAPPATGSPGPSVPANVAQMIDWLEARTEACSGPVDIGGGQQRWTCLQDDGPSGLDRTVYRVQLTLTTPDSLVVDAVVDQSRDQAPNIDRARGFLADSIAGSPATGAAGPELTRWVVANLATGGSTTVGSVSATLGPFREVTDIHVSI